MSKKSTEMKKVRIQVGTNVIVISGREKGKTGEITRINSKDGTVYLKGINMVYKTKRKKSQEDHGGIIQIEAPIHISNVMPLNKEGKPDRIGVRVENGKRVKFLKHSGEVYSAG